MATKAHCAFCFESLAASFDQRQPLSLAQVEQLWEEYISHGATAIGGSGSGEECSLKPPAISRLVDTTAPTSPSTGSSSSATPTLQDSGSSTPASSVVPSPLPRTPKDASHPLFVTWNTISASGHKSLRGCIGTFEALPLEEGLRSYALTSAFQDHRFEPIPKSQLPSLQVCVTLLTDFSQPDKDPLNWTVGEHGIRLSFTDRGRRYGATYLPDVAQEQGWSKEEAITSLMRKAGWNGRTSEWRKVEGLEIVRYEGKKVELSYREWEEWRDWTASRKAVSA